MKSKKFPIVPAVFCIMMLMIIKSPDIMESVKSSLEMCISVIIPSLFPFMVMSSVFVGNIKNTLPGCLGRMTEKIMGFSSYGTGAFICGILCGYPIGAKCASQLYDEKKISKSEAETLIACANNSGPLFIIGAVGSGLLNSLKYGAYLYAIHILCAIISAIILKNKTYIKSAATMSKTNNKSLTEAICESVINVLNVCGFVMFFSVVNTLIEPVTKCLPSGLKNIVLCTVEITNGIKAVTDENSMFIKKLYTIAFALGWSGLSVHMQVKSLVKNLNLSMKKYYITKLLSGILSPLLVFLSMDFMDTMLCTITPEVITFVMGTISLKTLIFILLRTKEKRGIRMKFLFFKN